MTAGAKASRKRHIVTFNVDPEPKAKTRGGPGPRRDTLFQPGNPHAFRKGESGNPGGRTKGSGENLVSEAYSVRLTDKCVLPGLRNLTWAEAIALCMCTAAAHGDTGAAREIWQTKEGRIPRP